MAADSDDVMICLYHCERVDRIHMPAGKTPEEMPARTTPRNRAGRDGVTFENASKESLEIDSVAMRYGQAAAAGHVMVIEGWGTSV